MKLVQLRDLLAVVQTGSLRSAGRHLGIAQPVITRSIRNLENELGQTLFERHSSGVSLTPVGERFVRRIESVQAELRRAKEEVSQLIGDDVGEVSVGLSPLAVMTMWPRAIAAFNKQYPRAIVHTTNTLFQPVERMLAEGLMDFWIGSVNEDNISQRFSVEVLMNHDRRVAARLNHPLSGASTMEELVDASWVRPSLDARSKARDLEAIFHQLGLPKPNVAVQSSSMLVTLLTAANTDLLTILPNMMFQLMPIAKYCAPLEKIPPIPSDPICLVHRTGLPLTPLAEKLSDQLRKAASNFSLETQAK